MLKFKSVRFTLKRTKKFEMVKRNSLKIRCFSKVNYIRFKIKKKKE